MHILQFTFPDWDRDLFLFLNGKHTPLLDFPMYAISTYLFWALCCIALIVFMVYRSRPWGKWAALFMMGGVVVNSLVNNLLKIAIMRPRPGYDPLIKDIMRQLEDPGSSYSFFSAHSSNSICLALFSALYFKNKYYSFLAFVWALTIAYSRIYVGKHYPLDVICGLLFGLVTGWISYWYYRRFYRKRSVFIKE